MKSKGKKTMKSQNHINKNTGDDVRKNNRISNTDTQCPKGKSVSLERHRQINKYSLQERSNPFSKIITRPPKPNDNRPSHNPRKKKEKNCPSPNKTADPRPPGPPSRPTCQTSQSPPQPKTV